MLHSRLSVNHVATNFSLFSIYRFFITHQDGIFSSGTIMFLEVVPACINICLLYTSHPVSRSSPHLRHAVAEKRRGRENAVRCSGPLFGGVHPEHLHPCHGADETRRSGHHRRGYQPADALKKQGQTGKFLSGPVRYFPARVGQCVSLEATAKIKCTKKLRITKENHRNQAIPVISGGDY